jgi:hypothetical protein
VRVPKLGPLRTFAVETLEATVVVHGTAFSVERTGAVPGAPPRTLVQVAEGSVSVHHHGIQVLLHAGDHWSSSSSPATAVESAPSSAPAAAATSGPARSKASTSGRAGSAKSSSQNAASDKGSNLAAENRLLQAAMAARQEGDAHRAAQLAGELAARFPASPLVEEARVERMRALVSAGAAAAATAEARSYLVDYPQGFARQEASRIVAGAPR